MGSAEAGRSGDRGSGARRAAARRLFEEAGAPLELIAGAMGLRAASLERLAAQEGWAGPMAGGGALTDTLDRLLAQLSAQLTRFEGEAESAEGLSKPQLDALIAITRTFDRLSEMRREEEARGRGRREEAELARAREAVERRVGELAEQRAETIIDHLNRRR